MDQILVTGAGGFVGGAVVKKVSMEAGFRVFPVVRTKSSQTADFFEVGEIDSLTEWGELLNGIDTVIHTAGVMERGTVSSGQWLAECRRVNVQGTLNLAQQAIRAGVRRFIFVSSIKVNGEFTETDFPYEEGMQPTASDPYSVSKFEAEKGLKILSQETGMEIVIIRPPLVYGIGVKGNFRRMLSCVERGIPLPLGAIHNKRSLIALDNLVDLIIVCIDHPSAANQTFLVSDGEDLSTTELLKRIGQALGVPAKLISVPPRVLFFIAYFLRKKPIVQRLCGSLQMDISKVRELLGWEPPISVDEGLRRAAERANK